MGRNIAKHSFTKQDFALFEQKTSAQLTQLKSIMSAPDFGQAPLKIGAELEMYLVDDNAQVSLSNQVLLADLNDDQFQPELNQYNIELNLSCFKQKGQPFTALRNEILMKTRALEQAAKKRNINIVPIGILPTLEKKHLNVDHMTDSTRYHCLANYLYQQRGQAFKIDIRGDENLSVDFDDICAEGANTSFQVHMMTKPELFTQTFNAAQLTLPLVTAIGANSAIFLGKQLWHETRVALFKQALDIRLRDQVAWQEPPRVNFGHGWLRKNSWELFAESVALYPPVIPEVFTESEQSSPEKLSELNLHMGTVWPWHRPVYDHHQGGHIRIEFRAIPAGPTSLDMVANAAFAIGLAAGLQEKIDDYLAVIPFRYAEYNFYRAAQDGLDAKILWPLNSPYKLEEVLISDVISKFLPTAKQGLTQLGVDDSDVELFINIIEQRLTQKMTGAIWQKNTLTYLEQTMTRNNACRELVNLYITNCRTCQPVATWEQIWT